ncbi:MAG TPA: hypothetical protein VKW08_12185 [Xanthobacteraceae bacterium]|nr:hypothetical protein [Xanthobacteraceae bacterium]
MQFLPLVSLMLVAGQVADRYDRRLIVQLSQFRAGLTADWLGAVPAVVLGGVATLAVVAAGLLLFPELARIGQYRGNFPARGAVGKSGDGAIRIGRRGPKIASVSARFGRWPCMGGVGRTSS